MFVRVRNFFVRFFFNSFFEILQVRSPRICVSLRTHVTRIWNKINKQSNQLIIFNLYAKSDLCLTFKDAGEKETKHELHANGKHTAPIYQSINWNEGD